MKDLAEVIALPIPESDIGDAVEVISELKDLETFLETLSHRTAPQKKKRPNIVQSHSFRQSETQLMWPALSKTHQNFNAICQNVTKRSVKRRSPFLAVSVQFLSRLFPFSADPPSSSTDAFLVSFSPNSKYCALLSQDSAVVFDNLLPGFPQLFSYKRDHASMLLHGPNHWFQWLNDETFSFGTCPGHVMIFRSPRAPDLEPIVAATKAIVSATFSAHGFLCLCISGPRIIFINERGETVGMSQVDAPFSFMRGTEVHAGSYVTCFLNNNLYTMHISKIAVESKWTLSLKQFPVPNVVMAAVSESSGKIAVAVNGGAVLVAKMYFESDIELEEAVGKGAEVIQMFWIEETKQLCIIRVDGTMEMWSESQRRSVGISLPSLRTMQYGVFDEVTRGFLFLDGKSLTRLAFCIVSPPLCVTASTVFSLSHGTKVAAIHNCPQFGEVIQLPPDIFPIARVAQSEKGDLCMFGGGCLVVIADQKLFLDYTTNVTQVAWSGNLLCAFQSIRGSHSIIIYTRNLKRVTSIASPHRVVSEPSSFGNRIVVCNRNQFTVIDFDAQLMIDRPELLGCVTYSVDWDGVRASISTFSLRWNIQKAVFGVKGDILLLLETNVLMSFPSLQIIKYDARQIWRPSLPDLLFIQNESSVEVWDECSVHEFDILPVCSSGPDFVVLSPEWQRMGFPFATSDFAFDILQKELESPGRCFAFAKTLIGLNDFPKLMNHLCLFSVQHGLVSSYIAFLSQFDTAERTRIVSHLDQHLQRKLAEGQFDFSSLFPKADPKLQTEILQASTPPIFLALFSRYDALIRTMSQHEKDRVLDYFIKNNLWTKAMRFCELTGIDLACRLKPEKRLSYTDYQQCYNLISHECNEWADDRQQAVLRMLGFTFILSDLPLWAMACLVLNNDLEKARLLLLDNPELPQDVDSYAHV